MWEFREAMARLASKKFSESARPGNDAVNRPEARMRRIYLVPCANQHGITGMRQMTVNNETFPVFHVRQFVDSSNPFFAAAFASNQAHCIWHRMARHRLSILLT
jgi:hypothetical protein